MVNGKIPSPFPSVSPRRYLINNFAEFIFWDPPAIETEFGLGVGNASLENGQITTTDPSITIIPKNISNALAHGDNLPDAMNYARRGFEKEGTV